MNADENKAANSEFADSVDDDDSDNESCEEYSDDSDSDDNLEEIEKEKDLLSLKLGEVVCQFNLISEAKRKEKLYLLDTKQNQILEETSPEYMHPVDEILLNRETRIDVGRMIQSFRLGSVGVNLLAQRSAEIQNYKNEAVLLRDWIKDGVGDNLKKLNEDRFQAENEYHFEAFNKRHRRINGDDYYPRPIITQQPYIVYNLKEEDIIEDLTYINCIIKEAANKN